MIIQANLFAGTATLTLLLLTSSLVDAPLIRVTVHPAPGNGLSRPSQVMVDKVVTVRQERLGPVFGRLDDEMMLAITRSLAVFLGIA